MRLQDIEVVRSEVARLTDKEVRGSALPRQVLIAVSSLSNRFKLYSLNLHESIQLNFIILNLFKLN